MSRIVDQTRKSRSGTGNRHSPHQQGRPHITPAHWARGMPEHLSHPAFDWAPAVETLARWPRFLDWLLLLVVYKAMYCPWLLWQRRDHQGGAERDQFQKMLSLPSYKRLVCCHPLIGDDHIFLTAGFIVHSGTSTVPLGRSVQVSSTLWSCLFGPAIQVLAAGS